MGLYQHLKTTFEKQPKDLLILHRSRLIEWRKEPVTIRIEKPTKLNRARALGYKAKPGFIIVRQRVLRGGRMRPRIRAGRRSKHMRHKKILSMSYQTVAEQRAASKYPNMEVLNSYLVGKDGESFWYEVIMLDKSHPAVFKDPHYSWVASPANRGRVFRGLTSSARKSRGLRNKGFGAEKVR
jgi:large subunit ribosomal protein L15e